MPEQTTATQRLIEYLPHGSGINGDWTVSTTDKTQNVEVSNTYSAMNEGGMYCHDWDFTVTYERIPSGWKFVELEIEGFNENICDCGYGLQEYLEDTMPF